MSNKSGNTHAENLDAEFKQVVTSHREYLDREIESNAALIKRLKQQQASRTLAPANLPLNNAESVAHSNLKKL